MLIVIAYISGVLGTIASLIEILQFFKILQIKHKLLLLVVLSCSTIICFSIWLYLDNKNEKEKIELIKKNYIKEDAKLVVSGMSISGYNNAGDFLSNLIQITGFYGRHKELYDFEYETYRSQVANWTKILNDKKQKNEYIYSTDFKELEGLVTAGKQNIEQLAK